MKNQVACIIAACLCASPVFAQETSQEAIPLSSEIEILQSPLIAKTMYRDAWEMENQPDLSYFIRIDKMLADGTIDETSAEIIKKTLPILKTISYNLKGKDLSASAQAIKSNPEEAINQLAGNIQLTVTEEDLKVLADLKALAEKQIQEEAKKTPGQTRYPINIKDFE